MALRYGAKHPSNGTVIVDGMSALIYAELDDLLSPPLEDAVEQAEGDAKAAAEDALEQAREGWQKLAYAIASGVVRHLRTNLEVHGVRTRGDVSLEIDGTTAAADGHQHGAGDLAGEQENVTFDQVPGTGSVE
jgi:hypothetical protein